MVKIDVAIVAAVKIALELGPLREIEPHESRQGDLRGF